MIYHAISQSLRNNDICGLFPKEFLQIKFFTCFKILLIYRFLFQTHDGIKSLTISRHFLDTNQVVDLWTLTNNNFDEWEMGRIPIPTNKDRFQVGNFCLTVFQTLKIQKYVPTYFSLIFS